MITFFFIRKKKVKDKQLILEEIADNIFGKMKEIYSPRYYLIRLTQLKGDSFFVVLSKKKGRLNMVGKNNLFENLESVVKEVSKYYSCRYPFFEIGYFP